MPTYQYRCSDCGTDLEVVQKFTDSALTECPNCGGSLRKVFNAVGVVFKGSGFYRTDSRAAEKSSSVSESKGESKPSGESSTKASETKSTNGSGSSDSAKPAASSAPAPAKKAPSSSSSTDS